MTILVGPLTSQQAQTVEWYAAQTPDDYRTAARVIAENTIYTVEHAMTCAADMREWADKLVYDRVWAAAGAEREADRAYRAIIDQAQKELYLAELRRVLLKTHA